MLLPQALRYIRFESFLQLFQSVCSYTIVSPTALQFLGTLFTLLYLKTSSPEDPRKRNSVDTSTITTVPSRARASRVARHRRISTHELLSLFNQDKPCIKMCYAKLRLFTSLGF